MRDEHGHAHAGRGQLDRGVEDLLGLDRHLPLFLRGAVVHELVDVRDGVEGDFLGQVLGLHRLIDVDAAGLAEQLVHGILARPGNRLVGRGDHALDAGGFVQRLERHHQLDGRAVRVGDDVLPPVLLGPVQQGVGVDLGHHQRTVGVHAEVRGVVDDDGARRCRDRRILGRHRAPGGEQGDVDAGKVEMGEVFDLQDLVFAEADFLADRAAGGDGVDAVHGELAFAQDREDFATDIAGRTDDCNGVGHGCVYPDYPEMVLLSSASTASPMPVQDTSVEPSDMMSPVRVPAPSTRSTAASSRSASPPRSSE